MSDYPTEETLERIEKWPYTDLNGLFDFLKENWWQAGWGWRVDEIKEGKRILDISTGGCSGNESIISALQANQLVWSLVWVSSRRGGHYEFEVREIK